MQSPSKRRKSWDRSRAIVCSHRTLPRLNLRSPLRPTASLPQGGACRQRPLLLGSPIIPPRSMRINHITVTGIRAGALISPTMKILTTISHASIPPLRRPAMAKVLDRSAMHPSIRTQTYHLEPLRHQTQTQQIYIRCSVLRIRPILVHYRHKSWAPLS